MMPGPKEWFFIFLIILLIFGAKRIPEIMRAMGRGLGEFRKARDDFDEALRESGPGEGQKGSPAKTGDSKPPAQAEKDKDPAAPAPSDEEEERAATHTPERPA